MIDKELLRVAAMTCHRVLVEVGYPENCCIAAASLTCHVLRRFGIECDPVTARVLISNEAYMAWTFMHGRLPTNEDRASGRIGDDCWAIGVNPNSGPDSPGMWNGHLVVVAENCIVDPSIMQFHRPRLGIDLSRCSRVFHSTTPIVPGKANPFQGRDCSAMYILHPENETWHDTIDAEIYKRGDKFPMVEVIVKEMRGVGFSPINAKETANGDGDDQRTARQAQGADGAKGTPVRRAGKATRKTR